jgi:hypothetical protein
MTDCDHSIGKAPPKIAVRPKREGLEQVFLISAAPDCQGMT